MKVSTIDLSATNSFNNLFLQYIAQSPDVKEFQEYAPDISGFEQKINEYHFDSGKRQILKIVLEKQYSGLPLTDLAKANIASLSRDNAFTITTGHQLNLCTGPLYFIYKLITTINLAKKLSQQFPLKSFVPVYWMASEDHDFEEINHFFLFNKKIVWENSQKGPVGEFSTDGIAEIFKTIQEKLPLFEQAYTKHSTLAAATRFFINELFGEYGLIVVDANDVTLKLEFTKVIREELIQGSSFNIVNNVVGQLEKKGFKSQATAREINLFYLETQLRERIIKKQDQYVVNNTNYAFSQDEIVKLADTHPENFSPNVLLRPLYQETILPNLAYVGGPAEIVYWLQLKELFHYYKIPFPVLIPRNFALYIGKHIAKKIQKLNLNPNVFFTNEENLKSVYLESISAEAPDLELQVQQLESLYGEIAAKAEVVDKSLVGYVMAEKQKINKSLEEISKKLKKAVERKNAEDINQVTGIKSKLFPEGKLQERTDNFLNFYINDPMFIKNMMDIMDPLNFEFYIVEENLITTEVAV